MSKKRKKRVFGHCAQCGKAIAFGAEAGIKHFQLKHPMFPEACYENYTDTWDPTLTRLVRGFIQQYAIAEENRTQVENTKKELAHVMAEKNSLVTRLNMVILALEQGQPK